MTETAYNVWLRQQEGADLNGFFTTTVFLHPDASALSIVTLPGDPKRPVESTAELGRWQFESIFSLINTSLEGACG